jgi:hypothetical protein
MVITLWCMDLRVILKKDGTMVRSSTLTANIKSFHGRAIDHGFPLISQSL